SINNLDRHDSVLKRNHKRAALDWKLFLWTIRSDFRHLSGLLHMQSRVRRQTAPAGQSDAYGVRPRMDLDAIERPRIERQPETARRHINTLAEGIERLDSDPVTIGTQVAAEGLPAKLRMVDNVCAGVCRDTKKVRPVVAGVGVPAHVLWKGMKRRPGKPF